MISKTSFSVLLIFSLWMQSIHATETPSMLLISLYTAEPHPPVETLSLLQRPPIYQVLFCHVSETSAQQIHTWLKFFCLLDL